MNKKHNTINQKKILRDFIIATLFLYFMSSFFCKTVFFVVLIGLPFFIILMCIYFFKVYKKELTQKDFYGLCGFTGMLSSIAFALLASAISWRIIFLVIIFSIIICFILILEICMSLSHNKNIKPRKSTAGVIIGGPAGVFGIMLSRYFRKNGLDINYEYIIGCLSIVYSFSYFAIIQYRLLKKQQKQDPSGDGSKPLKNNQSGDGSVIDD